MPMRLVQFIVIFVIFLLFIMFNLENNCDISFGFITIKNAPVYLTAFFSFVGGMICAVLFFLVFKPKKRSGAEHGETSPLKERKEKKKKGKTGGDIIPNNSQYGID